MACWQADSAPVNGLDVQGSSDSLPANSRTVGSVIQFVGSDSHYLESLAYRVSDASLIG